MAPLPKSIRETLASLPLADLEDLDRYLHELLDKARQRERTPKPKPEVVATERRRAVVYQLEAVRCGKEGCRCNAGAGHGPYWYAYYRSPRTGRLVKKYLGKERREIKPR